MWNFISIYAPKLCEKNIWRHNFHTSSYQYWSTSRKSCRNQVNDLKTTTYLEAFVKTTDLDVLGLLVTVTDVNFFEGLLVVIYNLLRTSIIRRWAILQQIHLKELFRAPSRLSVNKASHCLKTAASQQVQLSKKKKNIFTELYTTYYLDTFDPPQPPIQGFYILLGCDTHTNPLCC